MQKPAITESELHAPIAERWSPRVYDPGHLLTSEELTQIGEAFRWAPSSNNQQPWKLVLLSRDNKLFQEVSKSGLTGFNQSWAPNASAYAVVLAAKTHEGQSRDQAATYFDVGLASSQLVIQAQAMGLSSHFMGGIVKDEIEKTLGITEHWVVCVIAIGKQGSLEGLEAPLVERENLPRTRRDATSVYEINP